MDYDYDLFISYAWVDNQPMRPATIGWIDALVEGLIGDLAMRLGRREAFKIWFDAYDLRGHHEADNHIPEQVKRSKLFLAVMSPGYAASAFCQLELQTFVDAIGGSGAERLFVVDKIPIDEKLHQTPPLLRRPRKYQFWKRGHNRQPYTLGVPLPRAEEFEYYRNV